MANLIDNVKLEIGNTLSEEKVRTFSMVQLKFLRSKIGQGSISKSELAQHENMIAELKQSGFYPLTDASRVVIEQVFTEKRLGIVPEIGNPENALWRSGGEVFYTPTTMILKTGSGRVDEYKNSIIPTVNPAQRAGVQPLAILLLSFTRVKLGDVVSTVASVAAFKERWTERSEFNPFACPLLASTLQKVCAIASSGANFRPGVGAQSYSSDSAVREVYNALNTMEEALYYFLSTVVVFDFLSPFHKPTKITMVQGKEQKYTLTPKMLGGNPVVPLKTYTMLKDMDPAIVAAVNKQGYPGLAVYLGGVSPTIKTGYDHTVQGALKAREHCTQVRGSDKTGGSFLSAQEGYSGLAISTVRSVQRLVAMVIGVFNVRGPNQLVDIMVESPGIIPLSYTSLMEYNKDAKWKFLVTNRQLHNVNAKYRDRIETTPRDDSHVVIYEPTPLVSQKGINHKTSEDETRRILKEYQQNSNSWDPEDYEDYTVFTAVYGYYPWAVPQTEKEMAIKNSQPSTDSRQFNKWRCPSRPHYVHEFGVADSFFGIITTVEGFQMGGYSVVVKEEKKKGGLVFRSVERKLQMVSIPLVKTEEDWYAAVIKSNLIRAAYWCIAKPHYSPVSNVLSLPKSGITLNDDFSDQMTGTMQENFDVRDVNTFFEEVQEEAQSEIIPPKEKIDMKPQGSSKEQVVKEDDGDREEEEEKPLKGRQRGGFKKQWEKKEKAPPPKKEKEKKLPPPEPVPQPRESSLQDLMQ